MHTPFEELEYLAEFLPDEGESVVVTRRGGELVCETFIQPVRQDAGEDPSFYGRLVLANEQLRNQALLPICVAGLTAFWLCVLLHTVSGWGLGAWSFDVAIVLACGLVCGGWIRARQDRRFRTDVLPVLNRYLRQRGLERCTLVGLVRKRPELKSLFRGIVRWCD